MIIETKFNARDAVWVMSENKAREGYVTEISCTCTRDSIKTLYNVSISPSVSCTRDEDHVFASKQELLESL